MLDKDAVAAQSGSEDEGTRQEGASGSGGKKEKTEREERRLMEKARRVSERALAKAAKSREAEERRVLRATEKAERKARKAREEEERQERAAQKKALREARKAEKEEAKLLKTEEKSQRQQALQTEVDAAAEEARAGEETIRNYAKMSTPVAEQLGNLFIETKPKLKKIRPKKLFRVWIEEDCGIKYRTAHNYMTIAKAIAEEPELRDRGLTELYELLGLVTRKAKVSAAPDGGGDDDDNGSDITGAAEVAEDDGEEEVEDDDGGVEEDYDEDDGDVKDGNTPPPKVSVGSLEARYRGGCYVIELEEDWEESLAEAVSDDNFAQLLRGRGVLLRLADADLAS